MSNIVNFISASVQDKPVAAYDAFCKEIEDRVESRLQDLEYEVRTNMFASEENLNEAHSEWTISVIKPINKLKKGESVTVTARTVGEAMKKAAAKFGEPTLGSEHLKVKKAVRPVAKEEFEQDS